MASALRRRKELSFEGNVAENWTAFEMDLTFMLLQQDQIPTIRLSHTCSSISLVRTQLNALENLCLWWRKVLREAKVFKTKVQGTLWAAEKLTILRHRFNTRIQRPSEWFSSYFVDLRDQAESCEFGDKMTEFIRDRIMCGIHSDIVRRSLLREPKWARDNAYELCIMHEMADLDSQGNNNDPDFTPSVNAIRE